MPRQTWLADAARTWGLSVVEVNGWQTRGSTDFFPGGGVAHHTAGPSGGGDMPSLNVLINGRSDLPGPLCNYGLGRSGTVYVVAAGRANHAGKGGWQGLSGNSSVVGIEAENDGYQPWPPAQTDAYTTLCAAVCAATGITPAMWCRHHEWRSEKPDPHDIDGPAGRTAITARLAAGPGGRPDLEEDNVKGWLVEVSGTVWYIPPDFGRRVGCSSQSMVDAMTAAGAIRTQGIAADAVRALPVVWPK